MRTGVGDNSTWTTALAKAGLSTAVLARFDFGSGSQFVWTGSYQLAVSGTGDSLCDGNTFQPIADGVMIDIGGNQFSYSGSEAMTLSLAIPSPPTSEMTACVNDSTEWQGRACVLWRAVIWQPATATAPAQYTFARIRAGSMDELQITNDGTNHTFTITVEAHASMISNASGSTYLDQSKFDPNDTSQNYANSIANNPSGPGGGSAGGGGGASVYTGGGGGIGSGAGGGMSRMAIK